MAQQRNRFSRHSFDASTTVLVSTDRALLTDQGDMDDLIAANDSQLAAFILDAKGLPETETQAAAAGTPIFIAQKNGGSIVKTTEFDITDVTVTKRAYVAPVKQLSIISIPTTVSVGDLFAITIVDNSRLDQPYTKYSFESDASKSAAADGEISMVYDLVAQINNADSPQYHAWGTNLYRAIPSVSDAGTAIATSATVAAVKGATSLTTSAAHGLTAGDYISLAGDVYKTVTGTSSTTLVLDRPYTGETATIANTAALDLGAAPSGSWILGIEAVYTGEAFTIARKEQLENETVTYDGTVGKLTAVRYVLGSGVADEVIQLEKDGKAIQGFTAQNRLQYNVDYPQPGLFASAGNFYTVYHISGFKKMGSKAAPIVATEEKIDIVIAIEQADASTAAITLDTVLGLS